MLYEKDEKIHGTESWRRRVYEFEISQVESLGGYSLGVAM